MVHSDHPDPGKNGTSDRWKPAAAGKVARANSAIVGPSGRWSRGSNTPSDRPLRMSRSDLEFPITGSWYAANKSMDNYAFCSADGDFLIVPQEGRLWITTECGRLQVSPGEIVVIPQGFRFVVDLPDGPSRGYIAEIFGTHFELHDLGPEQSQWPLGSADGWGARFQLLTGRWDTARAGFFKSIKISCLEVGFHPLYF
ncbi:homogentisate 1 [Perilla frutescens var. frutescens]|nr:homogentisate 1 [Perilla frutescens var. frutescens]